MARRQHITLSFILVLAGFFTLSYLFSGPSRSVVLPKLDNEPLKEEARSEFSSDLDALAPSFLTGDSIAPKLENATIKAELGRATWKFLHTMMARFPENPTKDDRLALDTFMHLFARLYPCGQCAAHFRKVLAEYPPQTSSRNAAAGWLCFTHNIVNERVHKPLFDCNNIGDFYDCGCGDEKKEGQEGKDKTVGGQAESPDPQLHKH